MGSVGSGKYNKYKSKPTTASYSAIDLRKLGKLINLDHRCGFTLEWNKNGVVKNSIDCVFDNNILELHYSISGIYDESGIIQHIEITTTPCNFGGGRKWFICPECNKNILVLYGSNRFRCRKCLGVYHPSSNESELHRATRAMCNYQDKLNGTESTPLDGVDRLSKPKWMRYDTFIKVYNEAWLGERRLFKAYKKIFGIHLAQRPIDKN
jgi:hypothetical protein